MLGHCGKVWDFVRNLNVFTFLGTVSTMGFLSSLMPCNASRAVGPTLQPKEGCAAWDWWVFLRERISCVSLKLLGL